MLNLPILTLHLSHNRFSQRHSEGCVHHAMLLCYAPAIIAHRNNKPPLSPIYFHLLASITHLLLSFLSQQRMTEHCGVFQQKKQKTNPDLSSYLTRVEFKLSFFAQGHFRRGSLGNLSVLFQCIEIVYGLKHEGTDSLLSPSGLIMLSTVIDLMQEDALRQTHRGNQLHCVNELNLNDTFCIWQENCPLFTCTDLRPPPLDCVSHLITL